MSGLETEWTVFAELSPKHREVLDLLIEHKTSKEMSRLLDISPHTVDQRLDATRSRLGLGSRSELAAAYRRYLERSGAIYERLTYENFHIGVEAIPMNDGPREGKGNGSAVAAHAPAALVDGDTPVGHAGSSRERSAESFGRLVDKAVIVAVALIVLITLVMGFDNFLQAIRSLF